MTDLDDEVRETLSAPPDYSPRNLDFDQIMVAGTKLRRRRTFVTGAASVATALAVVFGGGQLGGLFDRSGPQPAPPPATASVEPSPTRAPKIVDNGNELVGPLGDLIATGAKAKNGNELVIFGSNFPAVDEHNYQFSIGERLPSGDVTEWYSVGEDSSLTDEGAPGFHATQYATETDDGTTPAYGYYVGATPAKITATYNGRPITAHLATWTYRPHVTVFWFDLADAPGDKLSRPKAYDAADVELPAGNNKVYGP